MDSWSLISPDAMGGDISTVLIPRLRVAERLDQLADEITRTYRNLHLTILAVLFGSVVFLSDLMRRLPLGLAVEFVRVRSYPGRAVRSQGADLLDPIPPTLAGRDVLILDDILDTGRTLSRLLARVAEAAPASLRTCVLLRKDRPDLTERPEPDFVGFDVADRFVVGYGLDYDGLYRNLPDVCLLRPAAGSRPQ